MWLLACSNFYNYCWEINPIGGGGDIGEYREYWVRPINEKRDIISFINELKLDAWKFYNYCCMSATSFKVLHTPQLSDFLLPSYNNSMTNLHNTNNKNRRLGSFNAVDVPDLLSGLAHTHFWLLYVFSFISSNRDSGVKHCFERLGFIKLKPGIVGNKFLKTVVLQELLCQCVQTPIWIHGELVSYKTFCCTATA